MKEFLTDPWYGAVIVFITQVLFLYWRTLNVIFTVERNIWGTIWTNNMLSICWLVSMAIGVNSVLVGDWQPIVAFLLGGSLGSYWGVRKK